MPGIHTIISDHGLNPSIKEEDLHDVLLESYFKIKIITETPNCFSAVSYYDGYPFYTWQEGDIHVILEGMIYNRGFDEIKKRLSKIALRFAANDDYKNLIQNFVETSDGDYIVHIWQDKSGKLLIFNDYLGRLALYYYTGNGLYVFSREIKTLLRFVPKIEFNKTGLADFLMLEYSSGNETIFKNIFRQDHSQIITMNKEGRDSVIEISHSADFNCITKNPFLSQKESIDCLKDIFYESVENRVRTFEHNKYNIIADLSGGYDSRTILAGLSKFTKKVSYHTFNYIQDESPCAKALFLQMGSPGNYCKLHFDNTLDFNKLGPLIYKTDGFINYYTTNICYDDLRYLKPQVAEASARFSGLGASDFLRKLNRPYSRSLLYGFENRFYSNVPLNIACDAVGLKHKVYKESLEAHLSRWPEKTPGDQIKRYYYEYLLNYQSIPAEDRERIHFWTTHPLWGLKFMGTVLSRFPYDWSGFKYYIRFMKALDPRLLEAPIFGSDIRLNSEYSVNLYERKYRQAFSETNKKATSLSAMCKRGIKNIMPGVYRLHSLSHIKKNIKEKDVADSLVILREYYNRARIARDIFRIRDLEEGTALVGSIFFRRALTLLIYLGEIEKRYTEKL